MALGLTIRVAPAAAWVAAVAWVQSLAEKLRYEDLRIHLCPVPGSACGHSTVWKGLSLNPGLTMKEPEANPLSPYILCFLACKCGVGNSCSHGARGTGVHVAPRLRGRQ